MLTGDEQYVILRLVNGEQVMAVLQYESKETVEIENPMVIRTFVNPEAGSEHITAAPWSRFSSNQSISIQKSHVIFIKNLHQQLIPHYIRLVTESSKEVTIKQSLEQDWDDEPTEEAQIVEDLQDRIDKLYAMLNPSKEETPEDTSVVVDGNDTIH